MQGFGAFADAVRGWLDGGLALVYPEVCQVCGGARARPADGYVCEGCQADVRFIEPPFCDRCGRPFEGDITVPFECANCREMEWHFHSARSAVVLRDPVLEVICRYKYDRALWFEPFLADLLIRAAGPALGAQGPDIIVPVPLHPTKRREREFNQAERLAKRLGAAMRIPVNKRLLRRVLPTRTQTQLSRQERLANVLNAFAARDGVELNGERVVLLDDVFTTGATTNACAKALIGAGAGEVWVWTVARGV
ncbi:MAG TPA: ComF family protein [Verrucomicrobiota bacterium]|nr:ComF family protein [Verrucomicrobiota bacterium]HQL78940.1 ComF family protein [Verrucomicrobiota bacterium]